MKKTILSVASLLTIAAPFTAHAALSVGAQAPQIVTQGALDGKAFTFDLRSALRRGPVVVYFYPKAFTQGCTLEARAFAEAIDDFAKVGATVIGLSNDDLPTLQRFSTAECRSKFAVAIASPETIRAYDVPLVLPAQMAARAAGMPQGLSSRTSYVIDRQGKIALAYNNLDYREHVRFTLDSVKALASRKKAK